MTYDGLGRRISKTVTGSGDMNATYKFFYDGRRVIETHNGSDQVIKHKVWGPTYVDELVQVATNDNPTVDDDMDDSYVILDDANFNVIGMMNDDHDLIERREYHPYGRRQVFINGPNDSSDYTCKSEIPHPQVVVLGSTPQAYSICDEGHQGLMHDKEIDVFNNRARYTSPTLCRSTGRDPKDYIDGNNLYAYLMDSPGNGLDPTGAAWMGPRDYDKFGKTPRETSQPVESRKNASVGPSLRDYGVPNTSNFHEGKFWVDDKGRPDVLVIPTYQERGSDAEWEERWHYEQHNMVVRQMLDPENYFLKPGDGFIPTIGFRFVYVPNMRGGPGSLAYFYEQKKKQHGSGFRAFWETVAVYVPNQTGIDKLVGSGVGFFNEGYGYNIMEQRVMAPDETVKHGLQGGDRFVCIGMTVAASRAMSGPRLAPPKYTGTRAMVPYDPKAAFNSAMAHGMTREAIALQLSTVTSGEIALLNSGRAALSNLAPRFPAVTPRPLLPVLTGPTSVTTPNAAARRAVQGEYIDPFTNTKVLTNDVLAADHVFPKVLIKKMPGFSELTPVQQAKVLNTLDHFQGLPKALNSSKGSKLDWSTFKGKALDTNYSAALQARQQQIRGMLQQQINNLLKEN